MKSIGIIRQIDNLGRIVLPAELRKKLEIEQGDSLEIYMEGTDIVLRKYCPSCIFCANLTGVKEYKGKLVCAECLAVLKKL
jgi:transcriptional pleiotropic regulator of transition state genes